MSNPKIAVLVTNHLNECDKYFDLAIKCVTQSMDADIELFAVSDAANRPALDNIVWDTSLKSVPDKWEYAVSHMRPDTEYFCMVSDDVFVSKWTLGEMARSIGTQKIIMGPMSNCDATTRYFTNTRFPHKFSLEDIKGREDEIMDYPLGRQIFLHQPWIGFYCVMVPVSVLKEVGGLDRAMEYRHNDVDYCRRAAALGILCFINLGVFAAHAGDRTIPKIATAQEYASCDKAFAEKYQTV